MDNQEKIKRLEEFKSKLQEWNNTDDDGPQLTQLRTYLNQNMKWVQQEILEAGCFKVVTISPPPIVGGFMIQNANPFDLLFNTPYFLDMTPAIVDMIDQTTGILKSAPKQPNRAKNQPKIQYETIPNYAFVAMPIDPGDTDLEDVLDAIKEATQRCGVRAERVDEAQSNERITDRILESIRKAEHIIVDVTYARPNVFFEAGYSQGIGKIPIYIAREGTALQFDLKDYPVIFFKNMKQLKDGLEKRLRSLAKIRA